VKKGGFDAFVGNPPFMGGGKITGSIGTAYREHILDNRGRGRRGSADLCTYFLLNAAILTRSTGCNGFITTNTIAQGDTREVGLDQLVERSVIHRALASHPWPGVASLEVSMLWLQKGNWKGRYILNNKETTGITPLLTPPNDIQGNPYRLRANEGKSFNGTKVYSLGFILTTDEAATLISRDSTNGDVLFPYLNGEDLNTRPDQSPSRWAINFFDWSMEEAIKYGDCFKIVEMKVKPERMSLRDTADGKRMKERWWLYGRSRPDLYNAITGCSRTLVCPIVTKYMLFEFVSTRIVFTHNLCVLPFQEWPPFAILSSNLHEPWAREYSSTLETRLNYSPTDCFETFPFPVSLDGLESIGERYHFHRQQIMLDRQEGLTKTYNCFHDLGKSDTDIQTLRDLHIEMDQAVAAAYGWTNLALDHGFHETKQGIRFTISEAARREVLQRLLKLNHERSAEEEKQGLHGKKRATNKAAPKKNATSNPAMNAPTLFDVDEYVKPNSVDSEIEQGEQGETVALAAPARAAATANRIPSDPVTRPTPIEEIETDDIMAAFRQAVRGRGGLERDELLKEVSVILGYRRLGPKIEEALRGHLRAAIRRQIIEADGVSLVRAGTTTMADYGLEDLRESFRSVMRKGAKHERDEVIQLLARHLGFARTTDTSRDAIKSAINSAIRQGILGYQGTLIWREE
jgi:hypothetical protein